MLFAYDTETALLAAVELVNSATAPDTLAKTEELRSFYDRHGYTGRFDADEAALQAVRALRGELRELLSAERDNAAEQVNAILAEAKAMPRLVRHNELDWHIHAVDEDAPFHRRLAVETAMAMVDLIRADELSRLSLCADAGCDGLVLDLTRNRARRFCSTRCANRHAAAAYRARSRARRAIHDRPAPGAGKP
jgi:predicted RNA-binding Zn ribbon-like protein